MGSWFGRVRKQFAKRMLEYKGLPINYVEIGCWKGDSIEWMLRNVLTNPASKGYGIDPYSEVRRSGGGIVNDQSEMDGIFRDVQQRVKDPRWTWVRQESAIALRTWSCPIDLLYIDGRHEASNVLIDFILAWDCLTVGSGVVFDDYAIGETKNCPHVPEAVNAIKTCFSGLVEEWGQPGKQAGFKVIRKTCDKGYFQKHSFDEWQRP